MSLFKDEEVIKKIREMDGDFYFDNLTCWIKKEPKYNIFIFSIYCNEQDDVTSSYEDLRDYIALYFQSQILEKNVERWNLYIYFLVGSSVDSELKFTIEQDKYSSRKIVKDCLKIKPNLEQTSKIIYSDLFNLDITSNRIEDKPLEESLNKNDKDFLSRIDKYDADYIKTNLENIIEELCYDEN